MSHHDLSNLFKTTPASSTVINFGTKCLTFQTITFRSRPKAQHPSCSPTSKSAISIKSDDAAACPIVFTNKPTTNLPRYKKSHSTPIIAPATTIKSATVPDTEHQGSAAPARTQEFCAQTVATPGTLTAQAGSAMHQDGQTTVRGARKQRKSTISFDQRLCFVNTGEKGFVVGTGFAVCVQIFGHSLTMVSIRCM
jgi:hypothetical protein